MKQDEPTLLNLVEEIVAIAEDNHLDEDEIQCIQPQLQTLADKFKITEMQALFLAVFINMFDDSRINVCDFSRFFSCNKLKMLSYWSDLETLCARRFVRMRTDSDGDTSFSVPSDVMVAIRENRVYETPSLEGMSSEEWVNYMSRVIKDRDNGRISYALACEEIERLCKENPKLPIVRAMLPLNLDEEGRLLLLAFVHFFVANNDEHIISSDLRDIVASGIRMSTIARELESGKHKLMKLGMLEHACTRDGQVESTAWHLTAKAKKELLPDIVTCQRDLTAGLTMPDKIVGKKLFYNQKVTAQVDELTTLLQPERFAEIQQRLQESGMRKGFACVFHGAPGTGKTETVLQLAKQTGRPIKMVDIPNLRSKWVGDTEKNIKAVFDDYRQLCASTDKAPILLFNEADAVICKRNEGATDSVDKMENAMQNIILQEMENLEGIMIATTNLAGNFDPAFERRFLYKIEFPRPSADERSHIWRAMMPDLSSEDALSLAHAYPFTGGQIENIARKQVVSYILRGEKPSLESIKACCDTESFSKSKDKKIGYC